MSEPSRMREIGVAGGTGATGGSCCSGSIDADLPERASRTRRIRRAFLLLASAAGLAWLGPEWHVSRFLVVLGSAILLGFWAVTLFSRAEPGALPRRAGPGALIVALGVLAGPWVSFREELVAPVLVEVFLPAKAFVGDRETAEAIGVSRDAWGEIAAEWALPVLDREPFLGATEEGRLFCLAFDLREEASRRRLGILAGRGEAIPEEEALAVDGALAFLNGAPIAGAEGEGNGSSSPSTKRSGVPRAFEATLEWELTREPPPSRVRIVELKRGEGAAVGARVLAPRPATFRLYRLEAVDNPGWWRVRAVLEPEAMEVRIGAAGSAAGADSEALGVAVEHRVEFAEGPDAPLAAGGTARLLVVSLDATVIGVTPIPVGG